MSRKRIYNRSIIIKNALLSAVEVLVLVIVLFPIIWMIPSAFKSGKEISSIPVTWWPRTFTMENIEYIFNPSAYDDWNFINSFFATLAVACCGVVLSLFFNMLTAFVLARLDFRGKKFFWCYFVFSMFVPGITILITSYKVVATLGMLDTFTGLVLPGVLTSYNIFFFRQFFLSLPRSLEEAAFIDGMNPLKIFLKIFIPLSVTPMIVLGASVFMGYWNSYIWPTLTITDNTSLTQMMVIIRTLSSRYGTKYGIVIGATLLSMTGPLIMFAFAQKRIVQGIAISGLK